jgi:hypothetical protein
MVRCRPAFAPLCVACIWSSKGWRHTKDRVDTVVRNLCCVGVWTAVRRILCMTTWPHQTRVDLHCNLQLPTRYEYLYWTPQPRPSFSAMTELWLDFQRGCTARPTVRTTNIPSGAVPLFGPCPAAQHSIDSQQTQERAPIPASRFLISRRKLGPIIWVRHSRDNPCAPASKTTRGDGRGHGHGTRRVQRLAPALPPGPQHLP